MAVSALMQNTQLQVMAVFAGRLGKLELATHNGCFQLIVFLLAPLYGITNATRTRIGNHLGNEQISAAKLVMKMAFCVAFLIGFIVAIIWCVCRDFIGRIFTSDDEIISETSSLAIMVGLSYIGLACFFVNMATLAAQGRPIWVAFCFLLGAWVVTVPLGYILGPSKLVYKTPKTGLFGIWVSMVAGYFVTTLTALVGVLRSDWVDIVNKTRERTEKKLSLKNMQYRKSPTPRDSGLIYSRETQSPKIKSGLM